MTPVSSPTKHSETFCDFASGFDGRSKRGLASRTCNTGVLSQREPVCSDPSATEATYFHD